MTDAKYLSAIKLLNPGETISPHAAYVQLKNKGYVWVDLFQEWIVAADIPDASNVIIISKDEYEQETE